MKTPEEIRQLALESYSTPDGKPSSETGAFITGYEISMEHAGQDASAMSDETIIKIINTLRVHDKKLFELRDLGVDLENLYEGVTGTLCDLLVFHLAKDAGVAQDSKRFDDFMGLITEFIYNDLNGITDLDTIKAIVQAERKINKMV